ncbi:hypothetical protein [Catellatospora sp. NPDC049609]|uniref:hypothetical protein n=1 Tax=Catellatospora sp. NPDC049609 TaxID=3155505 RepID=UPI0034439D62
MAAPTIAEVVAGIENQLATIPDLRVTGYMPDQISRPAAYVSIPPIDYRITFKGRTWHLRPRVVVLVCNVLDRMRERHLAEYADVTGPKSVFAAFAGTGSGVDLGGKVTQCFVSSFEPLGPEMVGQIPYYGGVWTLDVYAPGG